MRKIAGSPKRGNEDTYLSKSQGGYFLLYDVPAQGRICDGDSFQVEVQTRMFVDVVGNIWNV